MKAKPIWCIVRKNGTVKESWSTPKKATEAAMKCEACCIVKYVPAPNAANKGGKSKPKGKK